MILAAVLSAAAVSAAPADPAELWAPELIGAPTARVSALVPEAQARALKDNPQTRLRAERVEIEGIPFTAGFTFYRDRLNRMSLETRFPHGDIDGDIGRIRTLVARIEETRGQGRCIDGRKGERFDGRTDTRLLDAGIVTYICVWQARGTKLELNYLARSGQAAQLRVVLRDPGADQAIYDDWRSSTPAAPSSVP